MESVFEKSKQFEYLVTTYDPAYEDLLVAIEIVKDFIIKNKLIVYGGSAIDYALRLFGDKIYPDDLLKVPDLDVYSPNNVQHAYQLADILYQRGYQEARAINALHMETMRVDLMDNHFIADISYRPPEIFEKLPYLEYNGMRIIHPMFQRIDLHSSLAFPYDNSPREVIFERWSKDIKRFNKLAEYYPVELSAKPIELRQCTVPLAAKKYVFTGLIGYALVYKYLEQKMKSYDKEIPKTIARAKFEIVNDSIVFDTLEQTCEFVHFDIDRAAEELNGVVAKYEPYINLIPERAEITTDINYIAYSTKNRLVSSNSVQLETTFRVTNVQYLLKHFISQYFYRQDSPRIANMFLERYQSLLLMIELFENTVISDTDGPLMLSIKSYGNENINLAREIALNYLYVDLDGAEPYKIPKNYYPAKGKPHPEFDPEGVVFFRERGRKIQN